MPKTGHRGTGRLIRSSDFGLLSRFGLRFSDLSRIRFRSWLAGGDSMRQPCHVNGENFSRRRAGGARPRHGAKRQFRRAGLPARGGIAPPENFRRSARGVLETGAANQKSSGGNFRAARLHRAAVHQRRAISARKSSRANWALTANFNICELTNSESVLLPPRRHARQHDQGHFVARRGNRRNNFRFRARPNRRTSRCSLPDTARRRMKIRARPSSGRSD